MLQRVQYLHWKISIFKENVSDVRNSKVADLVKELKSFGLAVDIADPNASSEEFMHE